MAADFRFLRSPRWVAGSAIALVAVVAFVSLGFWQLRRLDERRTTNALIEAGLTAEPAGLTTVLSRESNPTALAFRRVQASGEYLTDDEVILQVRSLNGQSGHEVLTPLLLDDGTVLIVNRGWVTIDVAGPPVVGSEPPAEEVTVTGVLREGQEGVGSPEPSPRVERIRRVDLGRLQQQLEQPVQPVYLQLEAQAPAQQGRYPIMLPPPTVSEGSHLSYAVQWFIFATIVAIGFPVLVWRTGQTSAARQSADSA